MNNQQMLKKGVRLYYNILKIHSKRLTGKMRKIGDLYVKTQFRQHHTNPQQHYYSQFYDKWNAYYIQLQKEGIPGVAKPMSQKDETLLNNDQREALKELKKGLNKIK